MKQVRGLPPVSYKNELSFRLISGVKDRYSHDWGRGRLICDDFSRLYIVERGSALVVTEREEITLTPGNIYLFPAGHSAAYSCTDSMTLMWVHFRAEAFPGMDIFSRYHPPAQLRQTAYDHKRMDMLIELLSKSTPTASFKGINLLTEMLIPFLPDEWGEILPPPEESSRLMPAIHLMQSSYAEPLELATLAGTVHLHPTYFSNRFREIFGLPPMQYLTELRLRHAKEMLLSTPKGLESIARSCGFKGAFYFSRVFSKHTGICPSDYRRTGERARADA